MWLLAGGVTGTGLPELDHDIRSILLYETSGGLWLLTSTGVTGGLASYGLTGSGPLAVQDTVLFPPSITAAISGHLAPLPSGAGVILGGAGHDLLTHGVGGNGHIGARQQTDGLAGTTAMISAMASLALPGQDMFYMADAGTGQLSAYRMQSGTLTLVSAESFGPASALAIVSVGTVPFLLAADHSQNRVASFAIDPLTGALSQTGSLGAADGLGIDTPTALQTVTAHGVSWVFVAAAGSGTLSVLRLMNDGSLVATDHVLDTRDTRFDATLGLSAIRVQDHVFVLAGGGDDGLSLFTLLPSGQLLHLESLPDTTALALEDITDITAAVHGGAIRFFTASEEAGIGQFSIPLSSLGNVRSASGSVQGSPGNDLLSATGTGTDTLSGGAGNDILVSGPGHTVMQGGSGRDIFVILPGGGSHVILDFVPGTDRLDLAALPMLRSPAQLGFSPRSDGAELAYGGQTFRLFSAAGTSLDLDDIFPAGFGGFDRLLILNDTPINHQITGGTGEDQMSGGDGDDTIDGGQGNDALWAGNGNDLIYGGDGNDILGAADGNDRLFGGDGADMLYGGPGHDTASGGEGHDTIWADSGHDSLNGDDGNDILGLANGNDTALGGRGDDTLYGSAGHDLLDGGSGRDQLWGGTGNDTLFGGSGHNQLGGGAGDDHVLSGGGDDLIYGGTGADTLEAEGGDDQLWGMDGMDLLYGGSGDDTLGGGRDADLLLGQGGHDLLYGGFGADTLTGGSGADTLWGLEGADSFVFTAGGGNDVLEDFLPGTDELHFDLPGTSFADLILSPTSAGTLIDYGGGTLLLTGLSPQDISATDIDFL